MESRQAKFVYGLMVMVIFCWLVSPTVGNMQEPVWILPQLPFSFDASRAYDLTREFITRYPRRVLGSFEARNSTGFLQRQLASLGYQISYLQFDATIESRRQVGRDVLAFKVGQSPEISTTVPVGVLAVSFPRMRTGWGQRIPTASIFWTALMA